MPPVTGAAPDDRARHTGSLVAGAAAAPAAVTGSSLSATLRPGPVRAGSPAATVTVTQPQAGSLSHRGTVTVAVVVGGGPGEPAPGISKLGSNYCD